MMANKLQVTIQPAVQDLMESCDWTALEPTFTQLLRQPLNANTLPMWLARLTEQCEIVQEAGNWLRIRYMQDVSNSENQQHFNKYLAGVMRPYWDFVPQLYQCLRTVEHLLDDGMRHALQINWAQLEISTKVDSQARDEELKLSNQYFKIMGAGALILDGQEHTLAEVEALTKDYQPEVREKAWHVMDAYYLERNEQLNDLWCDLLQLWTQVSASAGYADYRAYKWQDLGRTDYTPTDCANFRAVIQQVGVPSAHQIYEKRRQNLNTATLRPWHMNILPPDSGSFYENEDVLRTQLQQLFAELHPRFGAHFRFIAEQDLLDMTHAPHRAQRNFSTGLYQLRVPYVFFSLANTAQDLPILFHEIGHSFHTMEMRTLPYYQQLWPSTECAEVPAMVMELLGMQKLSLFYNQDMANQLWVNYLEEIITFLPFVAVMDAFQHRVSTHPFEAQDIEHVDSIWAELYTEFIPDIDFTSNEASLRKGWQRKHHNFTKPLSYITYGFAKLAALQIWQKINQNGDRAIEDFYRALASGSTLSTRDFYAQAGASFNFEIETVQDTLEFVLAQIENHTSTA